MKLPPTLLGFCLMLQILPAQQTSPARASSPDVIRTQTQEVLLDIVVRDKKGKLVKDLKPEEIEITDDGKSQKIKGFRLVTGGEASLGTVGGDAAPATRAAAADPLRQVRVVTLAFQGLGTEGRKNSRTAALDLLKNEADASTYYGVFMADQRLSVLQQFTNDRDAVRKAVAKATGGNFSLFSDESQKIETELKAVAALEEANSSPTPGSSGPPSETAKAGMVNAQFARLTLNMIQFSQTMERTQQSRASIYSLLALIREQRRLPGRKTLLYFTEGLTVQPELKDQFDAMIALANRNNVTVYCIDAKGLVTFSQNSAGNAMMTQAAGSSRSAATQRNGPVTPDQATVSDRAEDSTRANVRNSLAELSEKTGGFLVSDSNDLRTPLRQISEEIGTYYEASYSPQIDTFDGSFHKVSVKVLRPNVNVQSRNGYVAMPYLEGQNLLPYEMPMLKALSATPIPRVIPYRSAALHYRTGANASNSAVVIDLPFESVTFTKDPENKVFRVHFSLMAVIKDAKGNIIEKLSQDVPLQRPLDSYDGARAGHFIYTKHLEIPPGRYTLETAVLDRENMNVGAKRQAFVISTEPQGLGISSLSVVRSVAPKSEAADAADLFEFDGGKVTPGLDDTFKAGPGAELGLYFVVYRDSAIAEEPKLTLEFVRDGKPVARGEPQLPAADKQGRIAYIARSPIAGLQPGQYEIRTTVRQGSKAVQEKMMVNVE